MGRQQRRGRPQRQETPLSPDSPASANAALYYPWLMTTDPVTAEPDLVPAERVRGGHLRPEDTARGVWNPRPASRRPLLGTTGRRPVRDHDRPQQGVLNEKAHRLPAAVPRHRHGHVRREDDGRGDANTAQQQWKYVAVRRMALFIEQSLYASLNWAVFEPNAHAAVERPDPGGERVHAQPVPPGRVCGRYAEPGVPRAVRRTTTTPTDVASGVVNILVGFAPLKPAEFVVVQIAQLAGQAQS